MKNMKGKKKNPKKTKKEDTPSQKKIKDESKMRQWIHFLHNAIYVVCIVYYSVAVSEIGKSQITK